MKIKHEYYLIQILNLPSAISGLGHSPTHLWGLH